MTRLRHPVLGAVLMALLIAGIQATSRSTSGQGALEVLERWTLDWRFRARGARAPSPDVAIVTFDDATAEKAGPLFERRSGWARVIRAAKAAGAKVIGIDAVFDVPERLLSDQLKARVAQWAKEHPETEQANVEAALLTEVARELDGDAELAGALRDAGNVVLIIFAGDGAIAANGAGTSLSRARYVQSTPGDVPPREVSSLVVSLPEISAAAKAMGFASVSEDETRTVRRLDLARGFEGGVLHPFTVPVVAAHLDVSRGKLAYLGPQHEVRLGDRSLPLDGDGVWLDYLGPERTFPTHSAMELVAGTLPAGALAGKIVLIGVTRHGYDVTRTPFGSMPGVEVQATAVDNLLRGAPLRRSTRTHDLLAVLALGVAVSLLFAFRGLRLAGQAAGVVLLLGAWLAGSFYAFSAGSLWLPWVGPALAALACAVTGLALSYAAEALQRRHLRKAFAHYLGEEVLDELVAHPEKLALGGERRELSVLFSDIRDFTTLSEKLAPERLVAFLNTYLSPMTRAVLEQGGLLDKYIGDAVMAVFGAPLRRDDHAAMALRCALEMHRQLELLNAGPLKDLGLEVGIGVGINTGEMVVGNMGSEERFDYTVTGDAVNLASRLEGLTRTYDVFCVVGEQVRRRAGEGFGFRELDLVQVKGKHEAVPIAELLAGPGRTVASYERLEAWSRAIAAWRAADLPQAREAFSEFARANPKDRCAALYLERLAALPETAPAGWRPTISFSTK